MGSRFSLRKRPDAGFESLYQRHVHDVYRYALAILGSPADAEDVTQTTFLNAYRAFERGERPRRPGHWLRAIAHNVCRQRFRQAARRPQELPMIDDVTGHAVNEDGDAPSAQDIARALLSLPFNQRAALVMRELEGRSQSEIAGQLEVSVSAVETLLFRARRALREQLESSLSCREAARAVSRQLDGGLHRSERAALRAHLRECPECAAFARTARAQRGALKRLGHAPLPASLLSWSGTAGAAGTVTVAATAPATGVSVKLAAGIAAVAVGAGSGDVAVRGLKHDKHAEPPIAARSAVPASQPPRPSRLGTAIGGAAPITVGLQTRAQPRSPAAAESGRGNRSAKWETSKDDKPAAAESRPVKGEKDRRELKPKSRRERLGKGTDTRRPRGENKQRAGPRRRGAKPQVDEQPKIGHPAHQASGKAKQTRPQRAPRAERDDARADVLAEPPAADADVTAEFGAAGG